MQIQDALFTQTRGALLALFFLNDPFLLNIVGGPKKFVIGDAHELEKLA